MRFLASVKASMYVMTESLLPLSDFEKILLDYHLCKPRDQIQHWPYNNRTISKNGILSLLLMQD